MAGLALVLLALLPVAPLPLAQTASLSAAAAASGRPAECSSRSKRALAKGPSIWELARQPTLQTYCDLLARAHAELPTMPAAAKTAAEAAEKALPGHAAPAIVLARAALAMGDAAEAARAFARARSIDPRSVEDPATMHDLARALRKTGKREEALGVYRALVPRVDLIGGADRRVAVLLEAAHTSMDVEGDGGAIPTLAALGSGAPVSTSAARPSIGAARKPTLDEAIAYLREARQRPPTELSGEVLLSLALVLDRTGARDEADVVLSEAARLGARARGGPIDYVNRPEEQAALEALALEVSDRGAAIKAWEGYLAGAGGSGPWSAPARARLEALRRGGGPARAGKAPAAKARGR